MADPVCAHCVRCADHSTCGAVLNISGARAWDSNRFIRDFDYFGYKFALLSSIGSAGLNSIINTLPARDAEEFNKFPTEDKKFIRDWLEVTVHY